MLAEVAIISSEADLVVLENAILGRKQGELTELMKELKNLSEAERKEMGAQVNEIKTQIENIFTEQRAVFKTASWQVALQAEQVDITQPALPKKEFGHFHPNTLVQRDLEKLFVGMGFTVVDGPELESEYYNFTAVNVPPEHPARDMQDTFYIKNHPDWVMRTHTSSMQVRSLQKYGAPLRIIIPGKCFRNEATDVRHEHTFYQLEGLVVGENINFSHLKGVLETVARGLYGPETKVRIRPKYYPFVEPGVNGEVTCYLCRGNGCRLCKNTGWLEVFGAGMVHPNVLKEGGVDPKTHRGFAFGLGLTRLVMLKYGIDDVRLLESGDIRFLEQFS